MMEKTGPENIFRLLQLRPPLPLPEARLLRAAPTDMIVRVLRVPKTRRRAYIEKAMSQLPEVQSPLAGLKTHNKILEASEAQSLDEFRTATKPLSGKRGFENDYRQLRDGHFATMHSPAGLDLSDAGRIERLLALYVLAAEEPLPWMADWSFDRLRALSVVFDNALVGRDFDIDAEEDEKKGLRSETDTGGKAYDPVKKHPTQHQLTRALTSFTLMRDQPGMVKSDQHQGELEDCDRDLRDGALTTAARKQMPEDVTQTVRLLGMTMDEPVDHIISSLTFTGKIGSFLPFAPVFDSGSGVGGGLTSDGQVRPAGVGDLLVVKQQTKRYEATELAHIENIMAGETRSRTHRALDRYEEVFVEEEEITREETDELETAERHEMNREISKTLKSDRKLGFELSLSGKYGPTVEFSSNLSLESNMSEEKSSKSATSFAREIMSKSTARIVERRRTERRLTVLRETEETNLHEFKNDTGNHTVGMYQFLDKVQENRVFNYGKRLMFDFMVPEPASYIWHLQTKKKYDGEAPVPPRPLEFVVTDASGISEINYRKIAALYGATDVVPPPPLTTTVYGHFKHGEGGSEEGKPRGSHLLEIDIPTDYRPVRVGGAYSGLTDDKQSFEVSVAGRWAGSFNFEGDGVGDGHHIGTRNFSIPVPFTMAVADTSKLGLNILVYESNNWTVMARVDCERTATAYEKWQNATYGAIHNAYEDEVSDYEQRLAKYIADKARQSQESDAFEGSTPYGDAPLANQIRILQELKKHCISILTKTHFENFGSVTYSELAPPRIRFNEAMAEGSYIRFFEQAFEWDQMQYVFYPYFWANASTWQDRFQLQENDRLFQEFLRAGEARVVAPVRPGFERAVNYFLETGLLWEGSNDPPLLGEPLYVSIITEIEERSGRSKGEVPVGEPWESRLPTNLVRLRTEDSLPEWKNQDEDGWDWRPLEEGG